MPREDNWLDRRLSSGSDPDPRFTLANERTFLAWVRSGLALIALGIAVATFVSTANAPGLSAFIAGALIILGGVLSTLAWFRWLQVERAIRHGRGIPPTTLGLALAIGMGVIACLALVVVLLGD